MPNPTYLFSKDTTLQQLIDAINEVNAASAKVIFSNGDEPVAAVIIVQGKRTKDFLAAIDVFEQERDLVQEIPRQDSHSERL